jgi:pimeloyl-ACP methyl ester carboxylesterase
MGPNDRSAVAAVVVGILLAGAGTLAGCAKSPSEEAQKQPQEAAGAVYGTAGKIHVDDGGAGGVPVVFVHAFSGNSGHWAGTLAHLRATRRALAFDVRGHGQSAAPSPGGYAVDSLAADIGAVADQLGLPPFVLVGHSLGGTAAAAYAGAHPERVAGLVLVSSPGPTPPEFAQKIVAQMEADYDSTMQGFWEDLLANAQPSTRARIESEKSSLSRETSLELIRAIFGNDPMPALRAYPGPVLIVDTAADGGPTSIHALAPAVPHRVIAGTSHWPQLDKPAEFEALLDEFLVEVDAKTGTVAPGAPGDTL